MPRTRRWILVGITLVIAAAAAIILSSVLTTVLLAGAASYVLLPVHRRLLRYDLPTYWSAIATSLFAAGAALLVVLPIVYVVFVRRRELRSALEGINGEVTLFFVGETPVMFDLSSLRETLVPGFARIARFVGSRLPSLSAKIVVFAFVVFAVLYYHDRLGAFVYGLIPDDYRDLLDYTHARVHDVLFYHFVLAFLGGTVTFLFGLSVFGFLGIQFPATVALVGALFWVLPVVNAAVFVLLLSAFYLLGGAPGTAVVVGVLGAVFLVAAPGFVVVYSKDLLGNPRGLSAPAYFVGFVGGGLTIGPAGVVLGPLAVTVLLAVRDLLEGAVTPSDL